MPIDLVELVGDGDAAVLTMEIQRGVGGDRSRFPELAAAAAPCPAGSRADRRGSAPSAPLISAMLKRPAHLLEGTDAVELVPELGPEPGDLVAHRRHGVSPFIGTTLDATLRALG